MEFLTHGANGNYDNSKHAFDLAFHRIELYSTCFNKTFVSFLKYGRNMEETSSENWRMHLASLITFHTFSPCIFFIMVILAIMAMMITVMMMMMIMQRVKRSA